MRSTYRYRSFFWPALLILVGVVALLANTGQIPADRLYNLVVLWPLVLVVIGLELIVRRALHGVAGDVAAALIIVLAIVGATAYVAAGPAAQATGTTLDSSAELGSISAGTLEIDAGGALITVTGTSDIGPDLYKAHIQYGGPKPEVTLDRETGELTIAQRSTFFTFASQRFTLDLQLNPSIPWKISQNTGAATSTFNLQSVQVRELNLNTGASRDEITLGQPKGIVPVQISGGSLTVRIHRPSTAAASVDVSGGAVTLVADGKNYHAIGHVAVSPDMGSDGYRIEVSGGACTVTLDSAAPSS